ncbi:MAG: hypothetical protein JRH03_00870 [Deltaproteobacteria bacterium]|nr:hypothetical protein [Deltaproteobacteria bacterium]
MDEAWIEVFGGYLRILLLDLFEQVRENLAKRIGEFVSIYLTGGSDPIPEGRFYFSADDRGLFMRIPQPRKKGSKNL